MTLPSTCADRPPDNRLALFSPRQYFEVRAGRVIGRFRVSHEIGRGGHGIVYQASDPWLDRHVALKTIVQPQPLEDATTAHREARLLSRVANPHVVALYDFFHEEEADVLVMELVTGPTLDTISRPATLRPSHAASLGAQLAKGLHALHAAGVVHGDIKPANLRLSANGVLKILDLGVARSTTGRSSREEELSGPQMIAGTIPYMSPEQLQGRDPDERSDIWSAGAVIFELATGQRAVDTLTPSSQYRFIREGLFPRPCERRPDIPPVLAAVITRAMTPAPSRRFQSARELLEALEEPSASRRIRARSIGAESACRAAAEYRCRGREIQKAAAPASATE